MLNFSEEIYLDVTIRQFEKLRVLELKNQTVKFLWCHGMTTLRFWPLVSVRRRSEFDILTTGISAEGVEILSDSRLNFQLLKINLRLEKQNPATDSTESSVEHNRFKIVQLRSKKVLLSSMFTQGTNPRFDVLDPNVVHLDVLKGVDVISWSLRDRGNTFPLLDPEVMWRTHPKLNIDLREDSWTQSDGFYYTAGLNRGSICIN